MRFLVVSNGCLVIPTSCSSVYADFVRGTIDFVDGRRRLKRIFEMAAALPRAGAGLFSVQRTCIAGTMSALPCAARAQSTVPAPRRRRSSARSSATGLPEIKYTQILHIKAGRKNTIATLTHPDGQTITFASSGMAGFKGAGRGTQDAALAGGKILVEKTKANGVTVPTGNQEGGVWVKMAGFGAGREQILRAVREADWKIVRLQDTTPIPWAGDRPVKAKRR